MTKVSPKPSETLKSKSKSDDVTKKSILKFNRAKRRDVNKTTFILSYISLNYNRFLEYCWKSLGVFFMLFNFSCILEDFFDNLTQNINRTLKCVDFAIVYRFLIEYHFTLEVTWTELLSLNSKLIEKNLWSFQNLFEKPIPNLSRLVMT